MNYWLDSRIEALPGAENLGEVDDVIYFRNKLFEALSLPRSYFVKEGRQPENKANLRLRTGYGFVISMNDEGYAE